MLIDMRTGVHGNYKTRLYVTFKKQEKGNRKRPGRMLGVARVGGDLLSRRCKKHTHTCAYW